MHLQAAQSNLDCSLEYTQRMSHKNNDYNCIQYFKNICLISMSNCIIFFLLMTNYDILLIHIFGIAHETYGPLFHNFQTYFI